MQTLIDFTNPFKYEIMAAGWQAPHQLRTVTATAPRSTDVRVRSEIFVRTRSHMREGTFTRETEHEQCAKIKDLSKTKSTFFRLKKCDGANFK